MACIVFLLVRAILYHNNHKAVYENKIYNKNVVSLERTKTLWMLPIKYDCTIITDIKRPHIQVETWDSSPNPDEYPGQKYQSTWKVPLP